MLENLINKLNPKEQFKKEFFKRLPQIKDDLSIRLDDLFLEAAEKHKTNPFELSLVLLKRNNEALGIFFNAQKQEITRFDAAGLIQEQFLKQLSVVPDFLKGQILEELGTEDTTEMVVKALKGRRLLIQYGEDDDFIFTEMTKKGNQIIDLDDFFNNFEF